jgi:adenosylcobinamide-GDP ribazoletransferase
LNVIKAEFSLFTIIPVNITGEDVEDLSKDFWLVPIIGLFYGLVAGGLFFLLRTTFNGFVSAILVILVVHMLNRFLHFDGLIDLGDGLVATGSPEKKLAAMKDTRVGAGGASYGILFAVLIIASLASIPTYFILIPLAMEVLAKNSLLTVAAFGKEREGLGSPFVKNTEPKAAAASALLSLAIILPFALLNIYAGAGWVRTFLMILSMMLASILSGWLISRIAVRNFGCVNGDVMGATNELSKAAVLLVALAVLAWS